MSDHIQKPYGFNQEDFLAIKIPGRNHKIWLTPKQRKAVLKQLKATDSPKPAKGNVRTTDPAEASQEPEGKPNE